MLESGEIRKLGSTKNGRVDVRVIAATNKNLQEEVKKGNFRDDLLYRLQVVEINVPPLRQRREDIPLLVQHFLNHYRLKLNKKIDEVASEAMEVLMKYDYPGNVRELENIIEQAIVVSRDRVVTLNDLPGSCKDRTSSLADSTFNNLPLKEIEKRVIMNRLKNRGNNLNVVARELGISRTTLWRKMKELGLVERKDFQF